MMSAPIIDSSQWPYVKIDYQRSMTEDDLEQYRVMLEELHERGVKKPCVVVVDTRSAPFERATLSVRRSLVGIVNAVSKRYPTSVIAQAVILQGELTTSVYMGYIWLIGDKRVARRSFRNKADAAAWAKSYLDKKDETAYPH